MDLKAIILNNLTISELESLLKEKKEMQAAPFEISAECEVTNFLLKILKYKNPKVI